MKKITEISIMFIGLVFFVLMLREWQNFLRPFALAIILTLLLIPILRFFKRYKIPKIITLIGLLLIFVVVVYLLVSLITVESKVIYSKVPQYEETLNTGLEMILKNTPLAPEQLSLKNLASPEEVTSMASQFISGLLSFISETFIAFIFTLFLVPAHALFIKNLEKGMDNKGTKKLRNTIGKIEQSIKDYLITKTIISIGTAVLSVLILAFFKSDFIAILGVLIFILNFIPNIGSFIAVFLAIVLYVLKFGFGFSLIWLLALLILVQIIFGNIIEPKFAGQKLKISPVVILLSLFIWYYIWGIVGMILSIPLTSIIKIILEHTNPNSRIAKFLSQ